MELGYLLSLKHSLAREGGAFLSLRAIISEVQKGDDEVVSGEECEDANAQTSPRLPTGGGKSFLDLFSSTGNCNIEIEVDTFKH